MKSNLTIVLGLFLCIYFTGVNAQVLPVELVKQSQKYWCWAGVSACVLNYYKKDQSQCTIAEYARQQRPDYYGNMGCCIVPRPRADSCNRYNNLYLGSGAIDDILNHFGNIKTSGQGASLDKITIAGELKNNRPFIIRWGWKSGTQLVGGHFIVGHGLTGDDLHYMDPYGGEGFKISKYDTVVDNYKHKWTHTLVLETGAGLPEPLSATRQLFYPNPANGKVSFSTLLDPGKTMIEITNSSGSICYNKPFPESGELDLSGLPGGLYVLRVITNDQIITNKLILR